MSEARLIVATVFDGLASLPDDSVDLVVSSPPFLALRSYLPADHPTKGREIGSEPTPMNFLDTLLDVVEACDRVLAPHGSLCFELGDTYAGSGGAGGDYNAGGLRDGQERFNGAAAKARAQWRSQDGSGRRQRAADEDAGILTPRPRPGPEGRDRMTGWPLDKSLCGTPTLLAWSLAYGRNLLRPERTTPPWRVRNLVAWTRPNPPVGALGDKCRPATSYITCATKSRTRWFDMTAVRTGHTAPDRRFSHQEDPNPRHGWATTGQNDDFTQNPNGAPLLDHWTIPTQPYSGSHYATFPEELPQRLILLMCPEWVCRTCAEPRRRIVEKSEDYARARAATGALRKKDGTGRSSEGRRLNGHNSDDADYQTLGWTDCGHDDYRRGLVLDPFAGSGTTLAVATGNGRDAVGIDLDARNADLARGRCGMFLAVETLDRLLA